MYLALKVLSSTKVAVGCYKTIKILNIENDTCIKIFDGHTHWVRDLLSLPDGTLVSCSQDKTIKFWNINDGQCIKTLNGHASEFIVYFYYQMVN
jgi:WD40 repeat protein